MDISGEDPQQIPKWPQMVTGFSSESRPALPLDCDVEPFVCQEWLGVAAQAPGVEQVSHHTQSYAPHVALIGTHETLGVLHLNWKDLTDRLRPLCVP